MKMRVTLQEYFNTQKTDALTHQHYLNAMLLLYRINLLREEIGIPFTITSGYRTPAYNASIGGSPRSSHAVAAAIDIADAKGVLKKLMMADDNKLLIKYDLYMESPADTPTWIHLGILPPKSGNRVFGK